MTVFKNPTLVITGTLKAFDANAKQHTENFKSRRLWVEMDDSYDYNGERKEKTCTAQLKATQSRCDVIDNFEKGQEVTVRFKIEGATRTWHDKKKGEEKSGF